MIVLINSSKTMVSAPGGEGLSRPKLLAQAKELQAVLASLSPEELRAKMHLSADLAASTAKLIKGWNTRPSKQTAALDAFRGDIYKGLVAETLSMEQRAYANGVLRILSGLYGILRPFDGIVPYRLELMYSLAPEGFSSLYDFWGDTIAKTLPKRGVIVNAASEEYFRVVRKFVDPKRVIEPEFLRRMSPQEEPKFVTVDAKIARGAFARWLIVRQITEPARFCEFAENGFMFDESRSTPATPVFVKG